MRPAFQAALLAAALPGLAGAQVEAFRYDPALVPIGRAYEYLKTNLDGTHPGRVTLYVAAADRIESLKWSPGDTVASLVVAVLDWERFSARRLESWIVTRGGEPRLRAALETDPDGGGVRISFEPERPIPIHGWPWHSYDFDFATLNVMMAHLRAPEDPFTFHRADVTYADSGPPFVDMGPVHARFLRREERSGRPARRYALAGSGLGGHDGALWVAVDGAYLIEFELPFPDEPGYADVRFRLRSLGPLTPAEWEGTIRRRVEDGDLEGDGLEGADVEGGGVEGGG